MADELREAVAFGEGVDAVELQVDERLRVQPGEYLIHKEHASAFAGTALVGYLLERRVDTLLITGCSTSACVRATATDAKSYRLRPVVVREGVQDRSAIAHEWTLFDIQARFAELEAHGISGKAAKAQVNRLFEGVVEAAGTAGQAAASAAAEKAKKPAK